MQKQPARTSSYIQITESVHQSSYIARLVHIAQRHKLTIWGSIKINSSSLIIKSN